MPEALFLGVGLDQGDLLARAPRELQVAQRLGVDREDRAGRAELRRHVADRGPVGQGQARQARTVELDELADHAAFAQYLGHGQDQVGGGGSLVQLADELEAQHLWDQHGHRLAQHRRLGLDPAHAPTQHPQAVDHRRVRVGAHQRVGIGEVALVVGEHDPGQVLEVDLVHDAGVRRYDLEVVKGALAPAQEGVALLVALELQVGVALEGLRGAVGVDLDGVVDNQLSGHEGVDLVGVAPHLLHGVAHRGQIDDRRHAGEVLHHHARGRERDLLGRLVVGVPGGYRLDILRPDRLSVLVAQQVLEQDLQRERQPRDVELGLQRVQAVDLVLRVADAELGLRVKAVSGGHGSKLLVSDAVPRTLGWATRRRCLGLLHMS